MPKRVLRKVGSFYIKLFFISYIFRFWAATGSTRFRCPKQSFGRLTLLLKPPGRKYMLIFPVVSTALQPLIFSPNLGMVSLILGSVGRTVFGQALATSVLGTQSCTLDGFDILFKIFLGSVGRTVFGQVLATSVLGTQSCTLDGFDILFKNIFGDY